MTDRGAPAALRVAYAAVFVGISAAALRVTWPEVAQLLRALRAPLHFGPPPDLVQLAVAVSVVGLVGALGIAVVRHRSPPVLWSAGLCAALCVGVWRAQLLPLRRGVEAANLEVLAVARQLHLAQVAELQRKGETSPRRSDWEAALRRVAPGPSPVRGRDFQPLPFGIALVDSDALVSVLPAGTFGVRVSEDRATFQLFPVGFTEEGRSAPLSSPDGVRVVLQGAYNPDLRIGTSPAPGPLPLLPGGHSTD